MIRRSEEEGKVVMLLGGGCSPATEPLAALAGLFYNLTQVSNVGGVVYFTILCKFVTLYPCVNRCHIAIYSIS